jgi:hypothetical protein
VDPAAEVVVGGSATTGVRRRPAPSSSARKLVKFQSPSDTALLERVFGSK